jgi:hypothetical protein
LVFRNDFWLGLGIVMAVFLWCFEILPQKDYLSNNFKRMPTPRLIWLLLVILMVTLMWQQWVTTNSMSLTEIGSEERFVRQERVRYYPEWFRRMGGWWELRPEMAAIRRVGENFFQAIDLNYYFFANHPREVIGVPIINKFSFIFYFIFLLGVVQLIKVRKKILGFWLFAVLGFGLPVGLLSVIGHNNQLGPFVIFLGMVVVIYLGAEELVRKLFVKIIKSDPF